MRGFWLSAILLSSACSRTGLLSADPGVGGASSVGVGGASAGGDDSGPPLGPTSRWIAVTTDDGTGSEQLFAVRFGLDAIEDVARLDSEGVHTIGALTWAPHASALAFTLVDANGRLSAHAADFRRGAPIVTDLDAGSLHWLGQWLDETHLVVGVDRNGFEGLDVIDLDADRLGSDPEEEAQGIYLSLSPDRGTAVAEYQGADGVIRVKRAKIRNGMLEDWASLVAFEDGFAFGPEAWSPDSTSFAWIAYDESRRDASGFPPFEIDAFDLSGGVPERLPSYPVASTDHPNYIGFAPSGSRYFVHSTRIVDQSASIAVGVQDTRTRAHGEAQPDRFFGTVDGMSRGGRGVVYSGYDDAAGSHGASFMDVTNPASPGPAQFFADDEGKPVRSGWVVAGGATLFALTGTTAFDWSLETGPVDWVGFRLDAAVAEGTTLTRLSEAATVDASSLSPDESTLVFRTAIASTEIPENDPLLYQRATDELGVYWVRQTDARPSRLPTKWTAYDQMIWLPDSRSVLRVAPADDPNVVSDTHNDNGQGVTFVRDGAYLLEWVQFAEAKVVAVTGGFPHTLRPGLSLVPEKLAVPDHWDE